MNQEKNNVYASEMLNVNVDCFFVTLFVTKHDLIP